jgi:4-carboxymuconolactone decarboxylase
MGRTILRDVTVATPCTFTLQPEALWPRKRRPSVTAMRIATLSPEQYSARQREVAERIAGRRGAVRGPFQVWLNSPELCERVEALGAFLRFESSLPLRLRELSLLIAARHMDAQYSWNAHVDKAVEEGVPRAAVEAIARHEQPAFDRPEDTAFYAFCHELLTEHFVSDATFAAALEHFGPVGLVDTVASLGNFTMLGMCLNAFQVDLQADREPPYPDIRGYARRTEASR